MTTAAPTRAGTARLSEVARKVVQPTGIVSTGWPAVEQTCRTKLGVAFDEWQAGAGRLILAKREDGSLAAEIDGVGMSLPRQVGKTYLLAGLIFGLCVNTPGLLVIWSAHHSRTHAETFLSMQAFSERPKVRLVVDQVFTGSGKEEIRFRNGSRILFGARERGFGRGIPGVDILVMDEAQILSDTALENMLATLNTSRFGLQLYIGTPPKPDDIIAGRSEVFMRMRTDATAGDSEDMVWIECGADRNVDLDNPDEFWAQVAKANPSYPHRTRKPAILRLRRKLKLDGFLREGLGIWPSDDEVDIFDMRRWASAPLLDRQADPPTRAALVIAASPDRRKACIGIAGEYDGRTLVLCHSLPLGQVAAKVAELQEAQDIAEVALAGAPPKGLKPQLVQLGVEFEQLANTEMGAACAAFQEAVRDGTVVHVGQPELDAGVARARTRMVGQSEQWVEDTEPALVACSGAFYRWGLQEAPLPAIY